MIDVQKLAREAGFEVHERKQEVRVGIDALIGIDSTAKLERFAALVLEKAEKAAETQLDEAEEARADKAFKDADFVGNPNDALSKGKHWMTVSTCNAVVRNCVAAIRSLNPKVEA